jgi:hypothetical protein
MNNVIKVLSNEGSAGKTIISILLASVYQRAGVPLAKFVCDKHHQEFVSVYGERDKGDLVADSLQDPIKGVKFFDVREEAKESINNLRKVGTTDILEDHPADSIDEQNQFTSIESFLKPYAMLKKTLYYVVPVVSDKSIKSIEALIDQLDGITTNVVRFIFVFNQGAMNLNGNSKAVMSSYNSNSKIQDLEAKGLVSHITIATELTESAVNVIKSINYDDIITQANEGTIEFFDQILLEEIFDNFQNDFKEIIKL